VAGSSCSSGSGNDTTVVESASERGDARVFVVDVLPDGFDGEAFFMCLFDDGQGSIVGYRGSEVRENEVYRETPFLRLAAQPPGSVSDEPFTSNGDEEEIVLNGTTAIAFTISTAEPVLHPWPAIRWEQDGAVLEILGEGLEADEVFDAAASVRRATQDELDANAPLDSAC